MPSKIKKYFYILLLVELIISYIPAQVFAAEQYNYASSGVSSQIEAYLCAPSAVDKKSTETTTGTGWRLVDGGYQQYAASNNANSGDLYKCINQLYKFAIILSAVIGVFFLVWQDGCIPPTEIRIRGQSKKYFSYHHNQHGCINGRILATKSNQPRYNPI
jgi:hypothetical protein